MKTFNFIAWATIATLAAFTSVPATAADAPATKQVCKDSKDKNGKVVKNKDGSAKQVCKTIKIHKKHEGTKVPDGKKK